MRFWSIVFSTFLFMLSTNAMANDCLDVFPAGVSGNVGSSAQLTLPSNSSNSTLSSGTTLPRGDNFYRRSGLGNKGVINVAAQSGSETTARLYFRESVSWQNVKINQSGNPEDLVIIVDGNLHITGGNTVINAIIYVTGNYSRSGNISVSGAITAEGSAASTSVSYDSDEIGNADFNNMCQGGAGGPTPPTVPSCDALFPGDRPFGGFGTIDTDFKENVTCNGSSNCSLETVGEVRNPTIEPGGSSLGSFNSPKTYDQAYNYYSGWSSGRRQVRFDDPSGTSLLYINGGGNDINWPENTRLNENGSPANMLIVIENGKLIVGKNSTINAFIYADTEEVKFEENTTFNGAITVVDGKLIIEKDSQYNYNTDDLDDLNPHGFCEGEPAPVIDHFEIVHDGEGLTCDAETITIRACADAACSTLVADATDVVLSINGQVNQTVTVTGSTQASFAYTTPGTATMSLDQTFECVNGASTSCDIVFADTGFRFFSNSEGTPIPTQLSGKPSNTGFNSSSLFVQAIQKNPATGACEAALTGNKVIEMAATCENPGACAGASAVINSTSIVTSNSGTPSSYTPVTLNFGDASETSAPFTLTYPDAGQIQLHARYQIPLENGDPSGNYMTGSSDDITIRPLGFYVDIPSNPAATDANGGVFTKAGQSFNVSLIAKAWQSGDDNNSDGKPDSNANLSNNTTTSNFGNEASPETAQLTHRLVLPSGGEAGNLTGTTFNNFSAGVATSAVTYSEVGIIEFDANLTDMSYINADDVTSNVPYIGRFIPDHFEQTVEEDGSLYGLCGANSINNNNWVYTGQLREENQTLGAINYNPGDEPVYLVTAYNANNVITRNYTADFAKLTAGDVSVTEPTADHDQMGKDAVTLVTLTGSLSEGTLEEKLDSGNQPLGGELLYTFADSDHFVYTQAINNEITPFQAQIPLAIDTLVDSDSVAVTNTTEAVPTGVEVRFGRLFIDNSFGPETSNLPQPMFVQYLDATGVFIVNEDDNCSTLDSTKVTLTNISLNPALSGVNNFNGMFIGGESRAIILDAPGTGNTGEIGVTYDAFPWLRYNWQTTTTDYSDNPSAIATFGIYRGNDRIIHWQEVNN